MERRSGFRASAPVFLGLAILSLGGCGGGGTTVTPTPTPSPTPTPAATAPGAPTIGAATAGDGGALIAFTAPASNGGAAITGYTATCTGAATSRTGSGTTSPLIVTGLANGTAYSCSVTATNSAGTGAASGTVSVTPAVGAPGGISTASILCPFSQNSVNPTNGLTSTSAWVCAAGFRTLSANGIPDHAIGTFPNANNPNSLSAQSVSFSATLLPVLSGSINTNRMLLGFALNGVKYDPGTAGTCPTGATTTGQCSLIDNSGSFNIEALGQSSFNFGVDGNNAHVQPGGAYHYHGVPEGILTKGGVTAGSPAMLLIGWAPDGYPVYGRYGRTVASDAGSALKVMRGSYTLKATPDAGRPSVAIIPMGAFTQDYQYVAGSGDLDECNGRNDVTAEFPGGIYHYYSTDTYPYLPRCWKGTVR